MSDRDFTEPEKKDITEKVAIAAIKYSILKLAVGKDIIFDADKSISFEGDSGPYLQYTYVRTRSLLAKAKQEGIDADPTIRPGLAAEKSSSISLLETLLYKFPEIVERAAADLAPNYIVTYLTELASSFNSYYATTKIADKKDPQSPYRVALTEAVGWILKNGLWLLGIETPEKM